MKKQWRVGCIIILSMLYVGCEQLNTPEISENRENPTKKEHSVQVKVLDKDSFESTLAKSNNTIGKLLRFPAEEKRWLEMNSDTAYTRDVLAGGETYISDAVDGETWNVEFVVPDSIGTIIRGSDVTFHDTYNGQEECFVSNSFVLCGSRSLYLLWYTQVQCEHSGEWDIHFTNNEERYATETFYLKPRIPSDKVPSGSTFNQGTYSSTAYDSICKGPLDDDGDHESVPCDSTYTEPFTIKNKGCYLTAGANILAYHGVNVDVKSLNSWLTDNKGYWYGDVIPSKIAEYARKVKGVDISYLGSIDDNDEEELKHLICKYGPQMIGTKLNSRNNPTHWVTVTGQNLDENTFLINDPDGGVTSSLASKYGNQWNNIRPFSGPKYTLTNNSNLTIRFHSPGELVLIDPEGRRVGLDPSTGTSYDEIPQAGYVEQGLVDDSESNPDLDNDPSLFHEIEIMQPVNGDYSLKVIGTGTGTYSLGIISIGSDFGDGIREFRDLSISPGVTHTYNFSYSQEAPQQTSVEGGFAGGGQRPRDVDKFLSYANPSEKQVTVPRGTSTFSLNIFYGEDTVPGSFSAEFNRKDISSKFNPVPGTNEIVTLNLSSGRNVIVLSMDGQLPKRVATDTDRLVIKIEK